MTISIDPSSGFCFGVTRAIQKAEQELLQTGSLYCLGDIVHNEREVARLNQQGLQTIDHQAYSTLRNATVLLRAHGEPPTTYQTAQQHNLRLIDATCPVVLRLQQRIHQDYLTSTAQIAIFGKQGHAEVLGLVAQTEGRAIVIETTSDLQLLRLDQSIHLYSQTTSPLDQYQQIVATLQKQIQPPAQFHWFDTICRRVSSRATQIRTFASQYDAILFVSGRKSSNGRALFNECLSSNPHSYLIEGPDQIKPQWLSSISSLGISGATSTPTWLMEECREAVLRLSQ